MSYFYLQKPVPNWSRPEGDEGPSTKKQPKRKAKGKGESNTWKGKEVDSLRNLTASKKAKMNASGTGGAKKAPTKN